MKSLKEKNLIEALIYIGKDSQLIDSFLTDLLTPAEYKEIVKRWEIVKLLNKGVTQHKISKDLHVGVATVTRGARALRDSKDGFKKILNN